MSLDFEVRLSITTEKRKIYNNGDDDYINSQDYLIVYATGAYNYSMFSNYNNMLKPALICVGDEIKVWSKKEELKDLMRLFK